MKTVDYAPLTANVPKYAGEWGPQQARHLISRTLFGVKKADLDELTGMSMEAAVARILTAAPEPPLPVNDYNEDDLVDEDVPWGETWVDAPQSENTDIISARIISFKAWWIERMLEQNQSIHEKMILFLHNHLVTQTWGVFYPKLSWQHFKLFRDFAFGNFKELVKRITIDPQMLIYLNGFANRKESPDENYARELQELFCIGKGPDAGYTEDDVKAAARVLTGWSINWENGDQVYNTWAHDEEDKQFSAFYNNAVIVGRGGEAGKEELDDLLDIIFDNEEVARFVVRKLYRFFVYSEIDESTEMSFIRPLAAVFRDSNYEFRPVLEALFTSEHFFQTDIMGAQIKAPTDFLLGFWRTLGVDFPEGADVTQRRHIRTSMLWNMNGQGMQLMDPPNVAGWPAYHQLPVYDKSWITTDSVPRRAIATDSFIYWGYWSRDLLTNVDLLSFIGSLSEPSDINAMIDEIFLLLTPITPTPEMRQKLKGILLTGQSTDSYWTEAWLNYESNPSNPMFKNIVEGRLKPFFQVLLQLSEFHLH